MKRWLVAAAAGGLGGGLVMLLTAWLLWTGAAPVAPGTAGTAGTARIRIPVGMTLSTAADTLAARGLLAHRRVFLWGARLTGQDRRLRAGLYELAFGQSPRDLIADLMTGVSVLVSLTIPEGWNSDEIAARTASVFGFVPEVFLSVADSLAHEAVLAYHLMRRAPGDSARAAVDYGSIYHWSEGMLAPDTYYFAEGSSELTVAAVLVAKQLERLVKVRETQPQGLAGSLAPLELLTLASIVEAEARRDDERALIAAVYSNRLRSHWRLEADPTVAFALQKKGQRLYHRDLKVDSPYNTYRHFGLPPGPIGAAGWASLQAAAHPDTNCGAFYFVADGGDGHVFSRTAKEHAAAVARFRAQRSRSRRAR